MSQFMGSLPDLSAIGTHVGELAIAEKSIAGDARVAAAVVAVIPEGV